LCDFGPDGPSSGRSPDRLDALVWALTALILEGKGEPRKGRMNVQRCGCCGVGRGCCSERTWRHSFSSWSITCWGIVGWLLLAGCCILSSGGQVLTLD
jgi:hypothetical protein